ncbi:MAG: chemotaxis response regulator protein-glutamate methylesterase [Chromatiales bacterium]|nr:chemotaxis response regulator protein-glutamate methylesterase [Chromatiales bacterium]
MRAKVKVLIVDDSAFFRRRIHQMLQTDDGIEVVGFAGDGVAALREARRLKPDVITMDVEMPVMDGITAVRNIMKEVPTSILMFSSLTHEGARATLDALDAGAADFLPKQQDNAVDRQASARALVRRVKALGQRRRPMTAMPQRMVNEHTAPVAPKPRGELRRGNYKLVMIGASTGGPVAIQSVLTHLPANYPLPVVLVVHMPSTFTPAYAERLNSQLNLTVKEAESGDYLKPGHVYLAPGGKQLVLESRGGSTVVKIKESAPGQTYKPSVDISFGSAARVYTASVLAVVLTGMGADGKQGAQLLKSCGSSVWSQDEASCVVYGMPQAVEKAGISDRVFALSDIGPMLTKVV